MSYDEQTLWTNNEGFTVSNDKCYLDTQVIYEFLNKESYWAKGIALKLVKSAVENSTLCYGIYEGNPAKENAKQVGFARVISDLVRFSYLADVFVIPEYRGRGLSKWLMSVITEHPHLKGTSFLLSTKDAHSLYAQYGFKPLDQIEKRMGRPLDWEVIYKGYGLTK
ncbi:N-acetyltransferase [Peribacillus cavernae]|uniref:N-acetyltransferase n=1 Tax=Peribacillus cavernae TaxID=1674310 RepID=A0A3S1B0J9_9BACI|nr:GNAT family N-acetyltransferase [Peribacillus cavernae]MDQ0219950.1 GNAT superfamily N-acetyltransferase [Peribacillus cavernae]RUQ24260.1 N-acetyltransferase [Peribacillus cavernae]